MAYRVTGLLDEDLRKRDHVGVVLECLRECDHRVGSILLVTISRSGKQSHEGVLR